MVNQMFRKLINGLYDSIMDDSIYYPFMRKMWGMIAFSGLLLIILYAISWMAPH